MAKHMQVKPPLKRVLGLPAVVADGVATVSLGLQRARVGVLVAKHSRSRVAVDHANWAIRVPVTTTKGRYGILRLLTAAVVLAALLVFWPRSSRGVRAEKCSEPVHVGTVLNPVSSSSVNSLGGVEVFAFEATCSQKKLRATVDSVTRRVLSISSD